MVKMLMVLIGIFIKGKSLLKRFFTLNIVLFIIARLKRRKREKVEPRRLKWLVAPHFPKATEFLMWLGI